jgi:hypothetical protein
MASRENKVIEKIKIAEIGHANDMILHRHNAICQLIKEGKPRNLILA